MAHFAKLNEHGTVTEIHCVHNNEMLDENGNESEQKGIDFLVNWSGGHPYWKQTSYNGSFRKRFAGVLYRYEPAYDAFIPPRPFVKWIFNEEILDWEPPIPYPSDDKIYRWDDNSTSWIEVNVNV